MSFISHYKNVELKVSFFSPILTSRIKLKKNYWPKAKTKMSWTLGGLSNIIILSPFLNGFNPTRYQSDGRILQFFLRQRTARQVSCFGESAEPKKIRVCVKVKYPNSCLFSPGRWISFDLFETSLLSYLPADRHF